jgi:hypothetical protein
LAEQERATMHMRTLCWAAVIATAACASASAACRDDLIKADQNINRTRSELQKAASAAAPVKCVAYRRHVASLTEVRNVFARCDTSADKAKNAAQTKSAIAEFTRQMRDSCKK